MKTGGSNFVGGTTCCHDEREEHIKMASQIKAIDDFCRLCAIESQSGVIIYSAEGENLGLEEKIISCLRIEVSKDDLLPKRVCQSCNLLLEDYYRFSERANQVQQTLYFLLGLHLPNPQDQDSQLYLIDDGVKVESNLIKKELDEFIVHQNNVNVEGEKFDIHLSRDEGVLREQKQFDVRCGKRNDNEDFILLNELMNVNGDVKQSHRRKMLLPKKTVQDKVADEGVEVIQHLKNGKESNCTFFKEASIEIDNSDTSSEEDEENKKLESEWRKQWGIMCNKCQTVFPDKLFLTKHYRVSHSEKPVYTCSSCKKSLEKYSCYKLHIFQHIYEGKFKCRFCDKKFCTKQMIQIHLNHYHNQMTSFICDECGMSFTSQPRLDFHQKKHSQTAKEELKCTECGKMLQTRGGLAAHKSVHKLGRHFMCHICGKTFTQKINMQQHVKHHKGERPHSCDVCKKSFAEKSHLNRHKSFHTKDRPFQCSVCKKMYKTERCLKVHSQTHWNSRPYICSICGKGFLSSTKLKQHHNCHTGERPFACKYCERTFTNYPNWLKHTRRRHKVDHKTGLSLKEEFQPQPVASLHPTSDSIEIPQSAIEFIEMPEVEVKEDGRDSVQSQHSVLNIISPSIMGGSQFQIVQNPDCQYHMNLMPELVSSQVIYSDHVTVEEEGLF